MSSAQDGSTRDPYHLSGAGLPPGRLDELQPRLHALLADFAHLAELETADLEPTPAYVVAQATGDHHE